MIVGLLSLLIFGLGYAWFVRRYAAQGEHHTALLVVIGVAAVLVVYMAARDWDWYLLACFALAGAPMVLEYYSRPVTHYE